MQGDTLSKTCTRCHRDQPLSAYPKGKGYRGGLNARCRKCRIEVRRADYRKSRDTYLARDRARYWSDPEHSRAEGRKRCEQHRRRRGMKPKCTFVTDAERKAASLASQRRYRERHRERVRLAQRAYSSRHPERVKIALVNNKAKRRTALGQVTGTQWKEILFFYGSSCALCHCPAHKTPLTIDHYIPISKGGSNTWDNVWPLCLPCNMKKGNRLLRETGPPHVVVLRASHLPQTNAA